MIERDAGERETEGGKGRKGRCVRRKERRGEEVASRERKRRRRETSVERRPLSQLGAERRVSQVGKTLVSEMRLEDAPRHERLDLELPARVRQVQRRHRLPQVERRIDEQHRRDARGRAQPVAPHPREQRPG